MLLITKDQKSKKISILKKFNIIMHNVTRSYLASETQRELYIYIHRSFPILTVGFDAIMISSFHLTLF